MLKGHNWNFIHIPKCGGMALRDVLNGDEYGEYMPLGSSCAVRSRLHRIPRKRPKGFVFTVVRHPASWLRSYWLDQTPDRVGAKRYLHRFWANDLDSFVANVCEGAPGYVGKMYDAHIRWRDVKVFKLENGLDVVLKWLGVEHKAKCVNGSNSTNQLSDESIALIAKTERNAIARYKYA